MAFLVWHFLPDRYADSYSFDKRPGSLRIAWGDWAEDSAGTGRSTSARGGCEIPMHKRLLDLTTAPRL